MATRWKRSKIAVVHTPWRRFTFESTFNELSRASIRGFDAWPFFSPRCRSARFAGAPGSRVRLCIA